MESWKKAVQAVKYFFFYFFSFSFFGYGYFGYAKKNICEPVSVRV